MRRFLNNPSSAQGIAAEIPQELERKARFLRTGVRKNVPILIKKSKCRRPEHC
jgi:hypothetical protein